MQPEVSPKDLSGACVKAAGARSSAQRDWRVLRGALLEHACAPYRRAGRFAYYFARGKLSGDPLYRAVLELGLLRGCRRVLDLGCGQGLLAAWLRGAERCAQLGLWPSAWPAPPHARVRGIEMAAAEVRRARCALGADGEVLHGNLCSSPFGRVDAVVVFDVLHYLPAASQRLQLQRIRAALPRGGLLLLRVADAGAGWRFRYTFLVDRLVLLARGLGLAPLYCHSLSEWRALLRECGFESRALPMNAGTPFANVLLVARAR